MSDSAPTYRERLHVPVAWWLLGLGFVASLWLALAVALPGPAVWAISAVAAVLVGLLLAGYGRAPVEVGEDGLVAGRARLDWPACGPATALDADAARRLRGVDADARAYLLIRPYLPTAVRVDVDDAGDPTPYWLVATRHPDRLAAAIESARRTPWKTG
ncbi:MAG: DUF3093 domain-containing protein [Nocardioidaceae bacterium]